MRCTIFLMLFLASCISKEERITTLTFESDKVEQEKVYPNGIEDSLNYILLQYHEDGSKEMEGRFVNGKEQGTFMWYYPNGNRKWVETYEEGVSVDTIYCYFESGKLKRKNYPPVNKVRKAFEYYESGELKIISFINSGTYIDSFWTGYFRNETIKESGAVSKGEKEGVWKYYDSEGNLLDSVDQTGESKVVFDFEEEEIKYRKRHQNL